MRGGYGTVILPGPLSAAFRSPAKQRCSGVVARKIGSLMGQVLEIDHMEGGLYWQRLEKICEAGNFDYMAGMSQLTLLLDILMTYLILLLPYSTRSRDSTLVEKIREAKEAEDRNRNIREAGILGKQGARAVARSASLSVPQRVGGVFQIFAIDRVAFDMNAKAMTESKEDCGGELLLDSASSPCKTRSRDSTLVEKIREAKEAEDRNRNIREAGILGKQGARAVARSASLSVPQRVGGVFQIFAIDRVAFDMNAKAMTESVAATKGVDLAVGGQQDFLWRDLIQLHVSGTQGSYPFNLGPLIYAQGNGSHLAGINLRRKQGRSDDAFDSGDKRACNAHLWVCDIEGARVEGLRQELTFEDTSLQVEETSFIRFPQGF
ncbi:hypothetical protein L3X38_032615 [Prunus dulcis]|uniref:Uncharacterized protein n=1 Tax=Prunus dulcis TaxID=3755 RepID=A0AAD4YWT1_PRUDU|nr:hypothetical protein L3X38_032615 [Prunus dulcis]